MKEYDEIRVMVLDGLKEKLSDHELPSFETSVVIQKGILNDINSVDDDLVGLALGDIGARLKKFLRVVDMEHPALAGVIGDALNPGAEFSQRSCEALQHASFAKESGTKRIMKLIRNVLNKDKDCKELSRLFKKPPVRILRTKRDRENSRKSKVWKPIVLKHIFKNGEDSWHSYPSTFKIYPRLSSFFEKDIKNTQDKMSKFQEQGLNSLSQVFQEQIDRVKTLKDEQYCGFYRISMTHIPIILARLLGHKYKPGHGHVTVSRKQYEKFPPFWVEGMDGISSHYEEDDAPWDKFETKSRKTRVPTSFIYAPRAYPLHQFKVKKSKRITDILKNLETFHDLCGRPVFDHYWAVCPSIQYPINTYKDHYCIRIGDQIKRFKKQDDAFNALDFEMTNSGAMNPVLIGEMNGKCYFICYWN